MLAKGRCDRMAKESDAFNRRARFRHGTWGTLRLEGAIAKGGAEAPHSILATRDAFADFGDSEDEGGAGDGGEGAGDPG